jgi:fatty-acyl-CoA synthase/long-chain acyl-CoA synthetase
MLGQHARPHPAGLGPDPGEQVARPDPTWGEAVTAYVVPEDPAAGEQLTERIRHALEARLARYKLPKRLHLVGSLDVPPPGPTDSEKPASP